MHLEYRAGYYGPHDFQHSPKQDREAQLQEELDSELPNIDLPVYLATAYFRVQENRYFVPVSLVVPASSLAVQRDRDRASLDVLGVVREKTTKFPVGNIRDTIQLSVEPTQSVSTAGAGRKNVQYNIGFLLLPGRYYLKLVVRENQNGRIGTFETDLVIPDQRKQKIKLSSVVLSSQRVPSAKKKTSNLLVEDGQEIVPNVAHAFNPAQPMTFYYEVYDPAHVAEKKDAIHLLTSISFFRGQMKVHETPLVEATALSDNARHAAMFHFEVPMQTLAPGWYTCQVNVIDDAAAFAFPRTEVLVRQP